MIRIDEFVKYHINGDGECNNVVLKAWSAKHCANTQDKFDLAYFFAVSYCVASAVVLFHSRDEILANYAKYAHENKNRIVFQSDRKYIRMKNSFEKCLGQFERVRDLDTFRRNAYDGDTLSLKKAIPYVSGWDMFGRFSAFLFLETYAELTGDKFENTTIVWKDGNTATSGLMHVFGHDHAADTFDKTGKLLVEAKVLDAMLAMLQEAIKRAGGNTNVTEIETSLCAYRKFFKASRYNGFYLDRMLEELYDMQSEYPLVCEELFNLRREQFDRRVLGEVMGWRGIRRELKKYYINTGKVNYDVV